MSLRVYALTNPAPLVRPPRGIDGERLRLITVGPVAAIVGDSSPRRSRIREADLRRYDVIMGVLAESRASLLPARFATTFANSEELTFVLRSRGTSLRAALARVRRRVQMIVRMPAPDAAVSRDRTGAVGTRGARSAPDSGAGYLRARAARAAVERAIPGVDAVRVAARRWLRAEQVERKAGVASVYHLIPRASAEAYRHAVERAAARHGLRVVVSGPWAPYAFAAW